MSDQTRDSLGTSGGPWAAAPRWPADGLVDESEHRTARQNGQAAMGDESGAVPVADPPRPRQRRVPGNIQERVVVDHQEHRMWGGFGQAEPAMRVHHGRMRDRAGREQTIGGLGSGHRAHPRHHLDQALRPSGIPEVGSRKMCRSPRHRFDRQVRHPRPSQMWPW